MRNKEAIDAASLSLCLLYIVRKGAQMCSYLLNVLQRVAVMETHLKKSTSALAAPSRKGTLEFAIFFFSRISFLFCLIFKKQSKQEFHGIFFPKYFVFLDNRIGNIFSNFSLKVLFKHITPYYPNNSVTIACSTHLHKKKRKL